MSRTRKDRRLYNGEIWGRSDFKLAANGKVFPRAGGEPVGSPLNKKAAKAEIVRMRRRQSREVCRNGLLESGA